jgi:hypothetical protein
MMPPQTIRADARVGHATELATQQFAHRAKCDRKSYPTEPIERTSAPLRFRFILQAISAPRSQNVTAPNGWSVMTIGAGLLLTAAGAVLAFAVNVTNSHGVNLNTVGYILMIIGVLGVLLDLLLFMPRRRRTTYVEGSYMPARRVTHVDEGI